MQLIKNDCATERPFSYINASPVKLVDSVIKKNLTFFLNQSEISLFNERKYYW
jgi:hypothetical protein